VGAKYILATLSVVFLALAFTRLVRDGARAHPQSRTWLLIGVIFALVSAYLFSQG
jgi:hypothetical protein